MTERTRPSGLSQRFLQGGMVLFLLGLATGLAMPVFDNPRMGLASHLEGILNGLFLIALGLIWPRVQLPRLAALATFWLAMYGTFANWLATLLAAYWGAGRMMPLAGGGHVGSTVQEAIVSNLLLSLSAAMIITCALVLYGLRARSSADSLRAGAAF